MDTPGPLLDVGELNPGPQAHTGSGLLTEPYPVLCFPVFSESFINLFYKALFLKCIGIVLNKNGLRKVDLSVKINKN